MTEKGKIRQTTPDMMVFSADERDELVKLTNVFILAGARFTIKGRTGKPTKVRYCMEDLPVWAQQIVLKGRWYGLKGSEASQVAQGGEEEANGYHPSHAGEIESSSVFERVHAALAAMGDEMIAKYYNGPA